MAGTTSQLKASRLNFRLVWLVGVFPLFEWPQTVNGLKRTLIFLKPDTAHCKLRDTTSVPRISIAALNSLNFVGTNTHLTTNLTTNEYYVWLCIVNCCRSITWRKRWAPQQLAGGVFVRAEEQLGSHSSAPRTDRPRTHNEVSFHVTTDRNCFPNRCGVETRVGTSLGMFQFLEIFISILPLTVSTCLFLCFCYFFAYSAHPRPRGGDVNLLCIFAPFIFSSIAFACISK